MSGIPDHLKQTRNDKMTPMPFSKQKKPPLSENHFSLEEVSPPELGGVKQLADFGKGAASR